MTSPFSDEQLSAVLDGLADPETVARVQASPEASARLEQLRSVSELVGTPPPAATPERRASSIAAALAAAESAAPEGVASLAVAREKAVERKRFTDRLSPQVLAAAAAILLVALITPFLIQGDDDDTSIATGAADTAGENRSLADSATDDGGDDAADSGDSDSADDGVAATTLAPTAEADLAEESAVASDDAMDDVAANEAGDDSARMSFANSPLQLLALIDIGQVQPDLFLTDPEIQNTVNPECLIDLVDGLFPSYALATIESTSGVQIVVIQFDPDGTNTLFDAEDCSPVG